VRVGVLFSGGKDSTCAAYIASKNDQLVCLLTVIPTSDASYMFHYPNLKWTRLQARSMGIPQLTQHTLGDKEDELKDLFSVIERAKTDYGLEGIYTGALASVYQRSRIESICKELGLKCISPLWKVNQEQHLTKLINEGFVIMIVSVSALGLDQSWLGRILDDFTIKELVGLSKRYGFNPSLEGGEGETFVLDCPMFRSAIEVVRAEIHWRVDSGTYEVMEARLLRKSPTTL